MKFRFCGDLDCPDWLLAEISILSKLPFLKMRQLCAVIVRGILGEDTDYSKIAQLTSDAKFEESDMKASVAALSFILSSAAKHAVDADSLNNELQQLGLPKENVGSLCKVYAEHQEKLREVFRQRSLRVSTLESVEWRVDYILSSSAYREVDEPCVQLKIKKENPVTKETTPITCSVGGDDFRMLLKDLKQAYAAMDNLSS